MPLSEEVIWAKVDAQTDRNVPGYRELKEWFAGLNQRDRKHLEFIIRLSAGHALIGTLSVFDGITGLFRIGEMAGDAELKVNLWNATGEDMSETPPARTVIISSGTEITDSNLWFHNLLDDKLLESEH